MRCACQTLMQCWMCIKHCLCRCCRLKQTVRRQSKHQLGCEHARGRRCTCLWPAKSLYMRVRLKQRGVQSVAISPVTSNRRNTMLAFKPNTTLLAVVLTVIQIIPHVTGKMPPQIVVEGAHIYPHEAGTTGPFEWFFMDPDRKVSAATPSPTASKLPLSILVHTGADMIRTSLTSNHSNIRSLRSTEIIFIHLWSVHRCLSSYLVGRKGGFK